MYLKALTLKGFKSFADKTDLQFEQGVTVVVGPNGSGKSNLVDAVAWVLGAQGARALRGAKMDDVIFAGTTKKPALGRAEVSLTIDNSDGTLPIEFSEVSITRTLFRSGESEYRLNDVPCRLLDIQELLSDSRIGRTQHVIIGQGQLDSVLNARPEDRRAIIEEAAGVLKYRKRREKSQRRLEATEGNMTRLGDLVREVRRQLTPLQRQADAAKRHDGVRDELKTITLFLAGKEISGLQAALERIATERLDGKEKEKVLLAELSELDMSILDAEAALMHVGDSDVAAWLTRAERLVAKTGATKAMLAERRRSITAQLDASADESVIESLIAEKEQLEAALAELTAHELSIAPIVEQLSAALEDVNNRYRDLMNTAPSDDVVRDFDAANKELQLHQENLSGLQARLEGDVTRRESIDLRLNSLQQDNKDAAEIAATEEQSLSELTRERDMLATNRRGLREETERVNSEHQRLQELSASKKAQYEVLVETFNSASADAGIEHVRSVQGVLGTLLENITIADAAVDACSAVLDEYANAIIVESPGSVREAMATLSAADASARMLVLGATTSSTPIHMPQSCTPLSQYITSEDPRIASALNTLFSHVVVTDGDWKDACEIALSNPDLVVVTSRGDRLGGNRTWSLGKQSARTITAESVEAAGREADNAARAFSDIAEQLGALTSQRAILDEQERTCVSTLNETTSRYEIAKQTAASTASAIRARRDEQIALDNEIVDINLHIENEQAHVEKLELRCHELNEEKDNAQARRAEFETVKRELTAERAGIDQQIRAQENELERTRVRINDARDRLITNADRLAKDPEQQAAAIARREHLNATLVRIDDLAIRISSVEEGALLARDVLSAERQQQTQRAQESSTKLESLRTSRRSAEQNLLVVRDAMQKGDITEAETRTRLANTVEMLRTNHDCEPDVAMNAEMPELGEGTTLTQRARELERDLKLMGPINPLAIQEYDELSERYEFLTGQLEDVKASRKELHKVIKTIDQEIVVVFEKAFEDVQKHFSDLFTTLFSGGSGRLTLTDPSDMLNTGIEMEARPSGKNVRRLSLLSGGERSLTALAFLFAVFRSRPSPFYIMDEVEAALDEPNLMRFLDLVAEFRDDAQLLIVSHQKKTMEAADELYGVTMAPGGSSRALRQKVAKPQRTQSSAPREEIIDLVAEERNEAAEATPLEATAIDEPILESSV